MKKRTCSKLSRFLTLGLSFFVMLLLISTNSVADESKPIKLTFSSFFPANHYVNTEEIPAWIEAIKEATNGRIEVTVYAGGTMLKGPETYDGVVNSVADIGVMVPGWAPGRFPAWEVFDLPGFFEITDAEAAALITWEAVKKVKKKSKKRTLCLFT